ncbi:unnamed protein product [Penicillium camemberti]|nr:unnamed protein product [Penicillium camemberti]
MAWAIDSLSLSKRHQRGNTMKSGRQRSNGKMHRGTRSFRSSSASKALSSLLMGKQR